MMKPERTSERHIKYTAMLSPLDLFQMLGIELPPEGTQVRICLARSHGDGGAFYEANSGANLVEARIEWVERDEGRAARWVMSGEPDTQDLVSNSRQVNR